MKVEKTHWYYELHWNESRKEQGFKNWGKGKAKTKRNKNSPEKHVNHLNEEMKFRSIILTTLRLIFKDANITISGGLSDENRVIRKNTTKEMEKRRCKWHIKYCFL